MGNLGETTSLFVLLKYIGSVAEINFRFPCVFRRRVPFPCSQVQSSARRALVGDDMVHFVLFFGIIRSGGGQEKEGPCASVWQ